MEISAWRVWAKVVAIVDVVILCINILGIMLVVFLLAASSQDISNQKIMEEFDLVEDGEYKHTVPIWVVAAIFVVAGFIIGIQMWAAVSLMLAAELGMDAEDALKNASTWKWITIGFLIIGIVGCIGNLAIVTLVITIVWRGGALFIVNNFMQDTENFISCHYRDHDNFPVGFTVNK